MSPKYDTGGICASEEFDYGAIDQERDSLPNVDLELKRFTADVFAAFTAFIAEGTTLKTVAARALLICRESNPTAGQTFTEIGAICEMSKQSVDQIHASFREQFDSITRLDRSGKAREKMRQAGLREAERRKLRKKGDAGNIASMERNEKDSL